VSSETIGPAVLRRKRPSGILRNVMRPYYKTSKCALYQCDNLELMKSLPNNYIDLIYCDILYGTGRSFKDYKDIKADKK
jgi:hypothetical protein